MGVAVFAIKVYGYAALNWSGGVLEYCKRGKSITPTLQYSITPHKLLWRVLPMKRLILVFLITFVGVVSIAGTVGAQNYKGLWVGTATLKYVSEVNKQYADLSFDLGLVGVKEHDTLIGEGDTWENDGSSTWRKTFNVSLPSNLEKPSDYYSDLKIQLWGEGSIVLNLNSEEILQYNLTSSDPYEFTLPATRLHKGENELVAAVPNPPFDLELTATLAEQETTELIPLEAGDWDYNDSGADPGSEWYNNPSGWTPGGQGQFGYGENDEQTTVSENAATVYFRKAFSVNNADFTHLRVLLLRDDGAVVYVNGYEILRSNMPPAPEIIEYTTAPIKALGAADEGRYILVDVKDPPLSSGTNVLAVEIHQHPAELGGSTGTAVEALTRTSAPLDLRLLFHVASDNTVRLLKEVIQVYDSNTENYVLLTDHTLVPDYTGVAIRDGVPVGRRLSAVGFDFTGTSLACNGGVSLNGTVECSINLGWDHPTNPFLHRYHPDHDNWDERYENVVQEAYAVTREIKLGFSDRYPPDEDLPERAVTPAGWGFELLGGYYTEKLTGLHKDDIKVQGPFILRKVAGTDTLTPIP